MSSIDYDQLRREVSLSAVLDLLGWEPSFRRGDERRSRCPLCGRGGKRLSFVADMVRGVWYCHRCRKGGGQLELCMAVWKRGVYDAARLLCVSLGKPVPYIPRTRTRAARKPRPPRNGEET